MTAKNEHLDVGSRRRTAALKAIVVQVVLGAAFSACAGEAQSPTRADSPSLCVGNVEQGSSEAGGRSISGLYLLKDRTVPANAWPSGDTRDGADVLAISPLKGNRIRLRLKTREINGHDCEIDTEALVCGEIIHFQPSDEERGVMTRRGLLPPTMRIGLDSIAFVPAPDGTYYSGPPYCGTQGYLQHAFPRRSRQIDFQDSQIHQ